MFPAVRFAEQAEAPLTPGARLWRAFSKADGLYVVDDNGAVTGPFGTGEEVAAEEDSLC